MADFSDMVKFQRNFDKKHGWLWWEFKDNKEFLDKMQDATLALVGEVGEFSNVLKKMRREHGSLGNFDEKLLPSLKEELIDIYIYFLILSIMLDIDVPEEYYKKMQVNEQRFKKFAEANTGE